MKTETLKTIALEESTNTHTAKGVKVLNRNTDHTELQVSPDQSVVVHGEHAPIAMESENVLVYRQNEFNPVLKRHSYVVD